LPLEKWHNSIGNPTMADAIPDHLAHNACKINLKGESMRKTKSERIYPSLGGGLHAV
jgi:DNA replication protein DnaC